MSDPPGRTGVLLLGGWSEPTGDSERQGVPAFHPDTGWTELILFGGTVGPLEEPLDDTWAFDPETSTWTELEIAGPSARGWHSMAADAETGTIVLFGGGPSRAACTDETWLFDPRAETWTQVA